MKHKLQMKYFLLGALTFYCAVFAITFLPYILKRFTLFAVENYIFLQVEFVLLMISGVYFLFCSKYYRFQWAVIMSGFGMYFLFKEFYGLLS